MPQMRKFTGFIRSPISIHQIQGLRSSISADDEMWTILEYYSEIEEVGIQLVKTNGTTHYPEYREIFREFQSYVRQAKSFYSSAKTLPYRSSSLLYYYSFLNLAKALIVIKNPKSIRNLKITHGINPNLSSTSNLRNQTIKVFSDNAFGLLYETLFGTKIPQMNISVIELLLYCTDISYQALQAQYGKSKILRGYYAHVINEQDKFGWGLIGISDGDVLMNYKKSSREFYKNYEKIELTQQALANIRDIFKVDAIDTPYYRFYQTKQTFPFIGENGVPIQNDTKLLKSSLKLFLQNNPFEDGYDFLLALPLKKNYQIQMNELIAIYIFMFFLSNTIRYRPYNIEKWLSKKEAWVIESFSKSCPLTFLRLIIPYITGTSYSLLQR